MDVQIISKEMIKPSAPTPNNLKNYKLSLLDQFVPSIYVPLIFFYTNNNNNNKHDSNQSEVFITLLKKSLADVLTIYYPLAGRLKDCASVECNDEGVEFIEAHTTGLSMSEFLEKPHIGLLNDFLPCNAVNLENANSSTIVLAKVKTTVFDDCGGIVIGFCMFHKIGDAGTASMFLNSWANISMGGNKNLEHPNFTFVSTTFPAVKTLSNDFVTNFNNFFFTSDKILIKRYVFDTTAIRTLKNMATNNKVPNPTRLEALTTFVTKHMMNASVKYEDNSAKPTVMITHAVNLRWRTKASVQPATNNNIFGNFVWIANAFHDCHTISTNDNNYDMIENVHEAIVTLNLEKVIIDLGANDDDDDDALTRLAQFMKSICSNNKIKRFKFSSWCNIGFYDINFGWGNPIWVALTGNIPTYGYKFSPWIVFIESTTNVAKGGIELWLYANEQEISNLEKDIEFLKYANPNPGINYFVS